MSAQLRVAVILTCYNEGAYIGAAVRSVLDQTRAELIDRIMIADDGSAADTVEVLKAIEGWDPRIRVIYGTGGAGLPAQRNRAITETSSPVLAILDGDDLWVKDKLERQLPVLQRDPQVGLVYADYFSFPDGTIAAAQRAGVLDIGGGEDLTGRYFLADPPIIPSTTLIRREAFDACGGFDASVRVFEDTDFYLRLSRVCQFALVNTPLLYKRNRATSITGGRKDLMAHHAFVALKAAAEDPRLMMLVPRRLAERARKLGNHHFLRGDREQSIRLLTFSARLDPFNHRAWCSLVAVKLFPKLTMRLLGADGRRRRIALGVHLPLEQGSD
jgi:glycosyltransferase involved in cell wall biosynthesis